MQDAVIPLRLFKNQLAGKENAAGIFLGDFEAELGNGIDHLCSDLIFIRGRHPHFAGKIHIIFKRMLGLFLQGLDLLMPAFEKFRIDHAHADKDDILKGLLKMAEIFRKMWIPKPL